MIEVFFFCKEEIKWWINKIEYTVRGYMYDEHISRIIKKKL